MTVAVFTCTVGCGSASDSDKIDASKNFLNIFFDFSNHARTEFVEAFSSGAGTTKSGETPEEALEEYYDDTFDDIAADKCTDTMSSNRYPLKFDLLLAENGITDFGNVSVKCTMSDSSDSTVKFEVTFSSEEVSSALGAPLKGELDIETDEEEILINSIRFC